MDLAQQLFLDNSLELKAEETSQGFLKGRSIVTRTGIFQYMDFNNQLTNVLRHPSDVFDGATLESMKMLPITWAHPATGSVTLDNAKQEIIGYTGEEVTIDGDYILLNYTITDKDAINAILRKQRTELSLGYVADLDIVDGNWEGQDYSQRQRNIRYNHLAVVDKANAGEKAKIVLDGASQNIHIGVDMAKEVKEVEEAKAAEPEVIADKEHSNEEDMKVENGKKENAKVEADKDQSNEEDMKVENGKKENDKVEADKDKNQEDAKEQKTDASKLQDEIESLKAERDALKSKLDEMKSKNDSAPENIEKMINDAINTKLKVINDAKSLCQDLDIDVTATPAAIKAQTVEHVAGVNIADKSASYIDAYFDIIKNDSTLNSKDKAIANQRALSTKVMDKSNVVDADSARLRMIENLNKG